MVGVVGSSPIAPTKFGRENKHLAETPSAFFLAVRKKYGKPVLGHGSVRSQSDRVRGQSPRRSTGRDVAWFQKDLQPPVAQPQPNSWTGWGTENSRKRRRYGAELKAQILHECDRPGASVATVGGHQALQLEQPRCICTGGHLTEPYEQNTQQSPGFGRSTALQCSHS